jgi:hypothetical protein
MTAVTLDGWDQLQWIDAEPNPLSISRSLNDQCVSVIASATSASSRLCDDFISFPR